MGRSYRNRLVGERRVRNETNVFRREEERVRIKKELEMQKRQERDKRKIRT